LQKRKKIPIISRAIEEKMENKLHALSEKKEEIVKRSLPRR
jgi:hypothetical protein